MIVVHDRFLTGSGTFVDASMLGGNASSTPAPAALHHGPVLNELQDSSLMVYDEDDEQEDIASEKDNKVAVAVAEE